MTPATRTIGMAGRLRLFAASLWVSLATAVLCAVIPAGLPSSTPLGSAFNPSTTAVALHSGGQTRFTPRRFERDDSDASEAGLVAYGSRPLLPVRAPEAIPPRALAPAPALIASAPRGLPQSPPGIAWPRGPPQA